jgi:deoxyhypusine synthase
MTQENVDGENNAPSNAKEAVFVASDPIPRGIQQVRGIDFNSHQDADISVVDMVDGMSSMGFQASAIGDAVRIINEMVRGHLFTTATCKDVSNCPLEVMEGR